MDELLKWIVGGGFFTGVGVLIAAYSSGRKTAAETESIKTKATSEAASSDSKRQIDEKDAALRQMYEYVEHVRQWLVTAHEEMANANKESSNDRRNLEDVKIKFDKLDHDYQDVRIELARERANNAKLAQENVRLTGETVRLTEEADRMAQERNAAVARLAERAP